ncbi:TetR/AcrR family transcriptional regulator [Gemmobacter lanyuensis]
MESVKILSLAKAVNLSRASFYWFFEDREQLLDALLAQWREKNTGNLVRRAEAYADTLAEAILNVCDCWFDKALFDSRFEFAVRSWALQSPKVLAEVQAADTVRIAALTALFERFGRSPPHRRCARAPSIWSRSAISRCRPMKTCACACRGCRNMCRSILGSNPNRAK